MVSTLTDNEDTTGFGWQFGSNSFLVGLSSGKFLPYLSLLKLQGPRPAVYAYTPQLCIPLRSLPRPLEKHWRVSRWRWTFSEAINSINHGFAVADRSKRHQPRTSCHCYRIVRGSNPSQRSASSHSAHYMTKHTIRQLRTSQLAIEIKKYKGTPWETTEPGRAQKRYSKTGMKPPTFAFAARTSSGRRK